MNTSKLSIRASTANALIPREELALCMMRELYRCLERLTVLTEVDHREFTGVRRRLLERRATEEKTEFARKLARDLL